MEILQTIVAHILALGLYVCLKAIFRKPKKVYSVPVPECLKNPDLWKTGYNRNL